MPTITVEEGWVPQCHEYNLKKLCGGMYYCDYNNNEKETMFPACFNCPFRNPRAKGKLAEGQMTLDNFYGKE